MKIHLKYLALIVFVILFSCDKNHIQYGIVAGQHDSGFVFKEFSPSKQIATILDTVIYYKNGAYSLDVDQDGTFDLFFELRLSTNKSVHKIGDTYYYPYLKVRCANNFEVVIEYMVENCGHGFCSQKAFVAGLQMNDIINNQLEWSGTQNKITIWIEPPIPNYALGWWYYYKNEVRYLAFRKKVGENPRREIYKYGWIKINCTSFRDMLFESFASQI